MYSNDPDVLIGILNYLKKKNISVSKIVLQKLIFFMKESGFRFSYSFEPYKYGPFSENLSEDIDMLKVDEKISINKANLELVNIDTGISLQDEAIKFINKFDEMLDGDYDFSNIELYGTVFYCIRSLEESTDPIDKDTVLKQFKGWKGNKFSDDSVFKALSDVLEFKQNWDKEYNNKYFDVLSA
jgi:uncharacterized protein YwgA